MTALSLTRLRLRAWRFLPGFVPLALRSAGQAERAAGFLDGAVLAEPTRLVFWTLTAWTDAEAMRAYTLSGPHRAAMGRLAAWCDESAVARWEAPDAALPDWQEADRRLRACGRPSKVRHPSAAHAGLAHAPPQLLRGRRLRPRAAG